MPSQFENFQASEFRIYLLDAAGAAIGNGPLTSVMSLTIRQTMDSIGEINFRFPASDPRAGMIGPGVSYDVYDRETYLGRFYHQTETLDETSRNAYKSVSAYDSLVELTRLTVGFRRSYADVAIGDVITDLLWGASGWTLEIETTGFTESVSFEGESILAAIKTICDRKGMHWRLKTPGQKIIEIGFFGADSGVTASNFETLHPTELEANKGLAIVTSLKLDENSQDIYNRAYPVGAGQGVSMIDIGGAVSGDYVVKSGTNADGSPNYYIEDTGSIAQYGLFERVLTFNQIRPISNSEANLANARNALKLAAEAEMVRHLAPQISYSASLSAVRQTVKPGDKIRLVFRGVVDGYRYVNIDSLFWVINISRSRGADGGDAVSVLISTVDQAGSTDQGVLMNVIQDVAGFKLHVDPTLAYSAVGPYIQRVDPTHTALFTCRIKEEVLFLNRALMRVVTRPLKSSVSSVAAAEQVVGTTSTSSAVESTTASGGGSSVTSASGGGSTSSGGGDHRHRMFAALGSPPGGAAPSGYAVARNSGGSVIGTNVQGAGTQDLYTHDASGSHTHTVPAHTHGVSIPSHTHDITIPGHNHEVTVPEHNHDLAYGIYEDNEFPAGLRVIINNQDVTTELGGPWGETNEDVDIELDITEYLVNASGGLRQNHRIRFECESGQGEVECEIDNLLTIQAIQVTL